MKEIKLSDLFRMNVWDFKYDQIGDSVNYKFIEKGNILYIFFEGSNSITDWVRNFLFSKRPYKKMETPFRVHRGFLSAWKEIEDLIIAKISDKKYQTIIIVGYSHGGALAGLCHECVWFHRPDIRKNIYGFGFEAPRFYAAFKVKKQLKERWENFYVIRTGKDIVTYAPPSIFGYCHVGQLISIPAETCHLDKKLPECIKAHYPLVVHQSLLTAQINIYIN